MGRENPKTDMLYLIKNEETAEFLRRRGRCFIGIRCRMGAERAGRYYISVEENIKEYQLINVLQEIFQEFSDWKSRMERLFYSGARYTQVLNEAEKKFGLVLMLVDKNLRYIASSDSFGRYNAWMGDESIMPMEMINELMEDENFRAAISHDKAFSYYNADQKIYAACCNIKPQGQYEARLLIQSPDNQAFHGGLALAEYLGGRIQELFTYHRREQERELYEFYEMMKALLSGIPQDAGEMERQLAVRGWKQHHTYQIYRFRFMEEENESVTRQYYRSMLEGMLKNCCVLQDGEEICCILNLSETPADKLDVRQDMSVFLRENLCKAGISRSFGDITLLNRYYREAGCALTVGQLTRNTLWYYQFGDLVLPYMWMQAVQELDASQLYHPGICALLEYDRREHTEMVRTVYEYMKHRYNVTETAKTLFIHRTTLLFRLQRIASIAKIDWEERVWIGITLELLRTEGPL